MTAQVHQIPDRYGSPRHDRQGDPAGAGECEPRCAGKRSWIGEMLTEAKKLAGHGKFIPWLEQNFHASAKQAAQYMGAACRGQSNISLGVTFALKDIQGCSPCQMTQRNRGGLQTAIKEVLARVENPKG